MIVMYCANIADRSGLIDTMLDQYKQNTETRDWPAGDNETTCAQIRLDYDKLSLLIVLV